MSQAWEPSARSSSEGAPKGATTPPPEGACCTCVFVDFWQAWAKAAWVPPALAWMKVGVPGPSPYSVGLAG